MKRTNSIFGQIFNFVANKLQNDSTVFYNELPAEVKAFANNNFPGLAIAFIEKEDAAYTLTFNDATKVTVNADGSWRMMDYSHEKELISLLPASITANIKKFFADAKIVWAKHSAEGYVVELTNTICMKYDSMGLAV